MRKLFLVCLSLYLLLSRPILSTAEDCAAAGKELKIESIVATADSWPNLRNQPGSLRYESNRMLTDAAGRIASPAPADACPAGCAAAAKPVIKYLTIPKKFRSGYSDEEKCRGLLEQTKQAPFLYKGRKFAAIDELAAWFGEFSKGSGADGSDLYKRCDGDCSPQYHTTIVQQPSGYTLDASVICGAARDKDENKYDLSISLFWACQPAAAGGG